MLTLGQRIRFYRQRANKSQAKIKAETDIPQTTLSGWERDVTEPTVSDAQKLAAALGVTIAELLDATDQQTACLPKTG